MRVNDHSVALSDESELLRVASHSPMRMTVGRATQAANAAAEPVAGRSPIRATGNLLALAAARRRRHHDGGVCRWAASGGL